MYNTIDELKKSLEFIYNQQRELSVFGGISALLGWDQMTYMPKNGATNRSEQSALISHLSHEKMVSDEFWNHIQKLTKNIEHLEEKDKIVVRKLENDIEKSRKIPSDFVIRMAKTAIISYQKWEEARSKNDFNIFSPYLNKIIGLEKEYCNYINLPGPKYNSLLDRYEEGMTVDRLENELNILKKNLVVLIDDIKNSKIYENQTKQKITLNTNSQKKFTKLILKKMLLPLNRSRIDESTHPFTTSIGYDDVRITTNYKKENSLFSFFSTIHEAGHALYELGLPQDQYKNTVISDSSSIGLHESQSRFWENMIARSKPFWDYFFPVFHHKGLISSKNIDINKWYAIVNAVRPSLIRVEADELTYCLHVILRFEIETDLIREKIKVNELPIIWNAKMEEMFGIIPSTAVEGVLQDMHWSGGSIGYFPTYAIGTIYASQLFNQLIKENPDILFEISQGNFNNIVTWLRKRIHIHGRIMQADEIIKKVCGEGLNSRIFLNYLKNKYYQLYDI
jgi:carboxypeptidase Taq